MFGWIKKAAVVGFGFKTASNLPQPVVAAEEESTGRIITFNVNNLSGEEGKKGTFKIQLVNEWAPRGAARFEVRSHMSWLADGRVDGRWRLGMEAKKLRAISSANRD